MVARKRRPRAAIGFAAGVLAFSVVGVPAAMGAWSDTAEVSGVSLATKTVPVPTGLSCSSGAFRGAINNWNAVAGATGYKLYFYTRSGDYVKTNTYAAGVTTTGDLSQTGTTRWTVKVTALMGTWESAQSGGVNSSNVWGASGCN